MNNIVSPADILFRIKLLFHKERELYAFCHKLLGFAPRHMPTYKLAFMHRSMSSCQGEKRNTNNERLEYLGDAILGAIVADILYTMYPHQREGFLTNTRSKLVKRETLSKIAQEIGLEKVVRPVQTSHYHNSYVYGNALEALIGAVYIDQGYERCKKFVINRIIKPHIDIHNIARTEINFKSKLLEWGQKHHIPIQFDLVETSIDKTNSQQFRSEINIFGRKISEATGYTKKESHQIASEIAIRRIKNDSSLKNEILAQAAMLRREDSADFQTQGANAENMPKGNCSQEVAEN